MELKNIGYDGIYDRLCYEEDERINNSHLYADKGKGNRKCEHITIREKNSVEEFLKKYSLMKIYDDNVLLTILWNLPRKEYNETKMWVCISGFTYNNEDFNPKHFVISDNNITEESQKKAMELLHWINRKKGY